MKFKNIFRLGMLAVMTAVTLPAFVACDDYMDGDDWEYSALPQLDEYIDSRADLSLFGKIIDQGDVRGMVHAYGTYTLFVPDNNAVMAHLKATSEIEAESLIASMTDSLARSIVKYHMLSDTLYTTDFINTRLSCANMEADYLTSAYKFGVDSNYYVINRTARITTADVRTGNGILHVVNGFLFRPEYSVQDVFNNIQNYNDSTSTKGYSILNELMQTILRDSLKTTLDELLGDVAHVTFLAQPDSVMEEQGLLTVEDVMEALQKNNISNYSNEQLLSNWIGYHFLKGRYYQTDIKGSSSMNTCTSLGKVITVTSLNEDVYLNRFEAFDDPGLLLDRGGHFVDFTCANGAVQTVLGELEIIERAATRINWDMADQPEIRALKGFRKAGTSQNFYSSLSADENGYVKTDLSMMSWTGKNSPIVNYYCAWVPTPGLDNFGSKQEEYVYGDYLNFRLATHVMQYVEITTPTLVVGKYKVWLRYRAMGTSANKHGTVRTTFKQDGQEDQVFGTVTLSNYGPKSYSRDDDESYSAKGIQSPLAHYPTSNYIGGVLLGTIDVINDGAHILRLDATEGNQGLGQNYDMLMFIPIDLDQVSPRVCADGSDARVYKVVMDEEGNTSVDRSQYIDVAGYNSDYRTHVFPNQCPVMAGETEPGCCPKAWCINHDPSRFDSEGNLIE